MSQLADHEITSLCLDLAIGQQPLIVPYIEHTRFTQFDGREIKAVSYGLSSYGYDFRLSRRAFRIFSHAHLIVDPKKFDERLLVDAECLFDGNGAYFLLPGNSYALGVTTEWVNMPNDLVAIGIGKSTYARCGVIVNVTPLEPGWRGNVTLEIANASPASVKVYADEGICQFVFFKGDNVPLVSYDHRSGKYQDQHGLQTAIV